MRKLFFLWIFVLFIYLIVAGRGKFQWNTTDKNYFSLQAFSLLRGRIDLVLYPQDLLDLSLYNNKVYLYWPPLPALFALPFVMLFGIGVSDIAYTAFWASFGPILLYLVLREAKKAKIIPSIPEIQIFLLTLFFAFGTVYFYLSVIGTVWFTSQVISMIILLSSLYFLFRYANNGKVRDVIISILLLGFTFWIRSTLLLTALFHFFIILVKKNPYRKEIIISGILIIVSSVMFYGLYNFVRFSNFFEYGITYQKGHIRFDSDLAKYGIINIHYLAHNLFYYLFNFLNFQQRFPYIKPDLEGNSILSTSPLFLLLFSAVSKLLPARKNLPLLVLLLTSSVIITTLLCYFATGWVQFGSRYILDAIPLLILSLTFVMELFPISFTYILLGISMLLNLLGVFWMQSLMYNI